MIEIRPAKAEDAEAIVPFLRERERSATADPAATLRDSLTRSIMSYAVFYQDRIALIWGVQSGTMLDGRAYLWMAGTSLIEEHPFLFLRYSQRAMRYMASNFEKLYGEVECDYAASQRWLTWLGAEIHPYEKGLVFTL